MGWISSSNFNVGLEVASVVAGSDPKQHIALIAINPTTQRAEGFKGRGKEKEIIGIPVGGIANRQQGLN